MNKHNFMTAKMTSTKLKEGAKSSRIYEINSVTSSNWHTSSENIHYHIAKDANT